MNQKKNFTKAKARIRVDDEASSSSSNLSTVYSRQEHARPRSRAENNILSPSLSDTSTSSSQQSLSSSINRFRTDFDELKCKMKIFGESLNLCRCIAHDFKIKLNNMERRLNLLEKGILRNTSNYSAIIQKNRRLSHKTLEDAKRLQMCGTEEERCEVAARICRNYLSGAWKTVDPHTLLFKRISGGLSNFIYFVALPDSTKPGTRDSSAWLEEEDLSGILSRTERSHSFSVIEEPRNVLLRIYGQVHGERAMDSIVTESVVFTLLSERRLGPKLHGVFSGGRIEEYIPARCLFVRELGDPTISLKIAEKMAAIHSMNVPLAKEPTWLWKNLTKWIKTIKDDKIIVSYVPKTNEESRIIEEMKVIDFNKEVEWLKKYLETFASPVVFCHNDLQEGNILLLEDTPVFVHPLPIGEEEENTAESANASSDQYQANEESQKELPVNEVIASDSLLSTTDLEKPRLILIDFEYCAYNYRGFDIANHFQEWIFDYTHHSYPYYYILEECTPTATQKEAFIRNYLINYTTNISEDADRQQPTTGAINKIRNEIDAFALASHLFWSLWSLVNASKSKITFGYWDYAFTRFQYYKNLKDVEINKISLPRRTYSDLDKA